MDGLVPAWTVSAFFESELPLIPGTLSTFQITLIVIGEDAPDSESAQALVVSHVCHATLIMTELRFTPFPRERLP